MRSESVDFLDPRWYPADLDLVRRRIAMLQIDEGVVERSTFMDTRLDADMSAAKVIGLDAVPAQSGGGDSVAWLLHTSFCCSTLLARVLSCPLSSMVLREPLVLRRLADASGQQRLDQELFRAMVGLLGRRWVDDGRVLIKPTHAALNIGVELLLATPTARVLVLTSSLEDFLISNLKKTTETQSRIPLLVERALQAGTWHRKLPKEAFAPPSLIAAAGLQWAAQRELILEIAERVDGDRIRVLDAETLLADVPSVAAQAASWLQLPLDEHALLAKATALAGRHAKAETRVYGAAERAAEAAMVARAFEQDLRHSRQWVEKYLLPVMDSRAIGLDGGRMSLVG